MKVIECPVQLGLLNDLLTKIYSINGNLSSIISDRPNPVDYNTVICAFGYVNSMYEIFRKNLYLKKLDININPKDYFSDIDISIIDEMLSRYKKVLDTYDIVASAFSPEYTQYFESMYKAIKYYDSEITHLKDNIDNINALGVIEKLLNVDKYSFQYTCKDKQEFLDQLFKDTMKFRNAIFDIVNNLDIPSKADWKYDL